MLRKEAHESRLVYQHATSWMAWLIALCTIAECVYAFIHIPASGSFSLPFFEVKTDLVLFVESAAWHLYRFLPLAIAFGAVISLTRLLPHVGLWIMHWCFRLISVSWLVLGICIMWETIPFTIQADLVEVFTILLLVGLLLAGFCVAMMLFFYNLSEVCNEMAFSLCRKELHHPVGHTCTIGGFCLVFAPLLLLAPFLGNLEETFLMTALDPEAGLQLPQWLRGTLFMANGEEAALSYMFAKGIFQAHPAMQTLEQWEKIGANMFRPADMPVWLAVLSAGKYVLLFFFYRGYLNAHQLEHPWQNPAVDSPAATERKETEDELPAEAES